jgi:hypothetical protein
MPDPLASPTEPHPKPQPKPGLTGWRKVLLLVGVAALVLRLLLALLMHSGGPDKVSTSVPTTIQQGDVFTFAPGDANIAKWAANPASNGFVVQELERDGRTLADTRICALLPDYMAAGDKAGGKLLITGQQPGGAWLVRWTGGATMPPRNKSDDFDSDCGPNALILMSTSQLHDLADILSGVPVANRQDYKPPVVTASPPQTK